MHFQTLFNANNVLDNYYGCESQNYFCLQDSSEVSEIKQLREELERKDDVISSFKTVVKARLYEFINRIVYFSCSR